MRKNCKRKKGQSKMFTNVACENIIKQTVMARNISTMIYEEIDKLYDQKLYSVFENYIEFTLNYDSVSASLKDALMLADKNMLTIVVDMMTQMRKFKKVSISRLDVCIVVNFTPQIKEPEPKKEEPEKDEPKEETKKEGDFNEDTVSGT